MQILQTKFIVQKPHTHTIPQRSYVRKALILVIEARSVSVTPILCAAVPQHCKEKNEGERQGPNPGDEALDHEPQIFPHANFALRVDCHMKPLSLCQVTDPPKPQECPAKCVGAFCVNCATLII